MSKHSSGVIENSEMLARFVFSPQQIDKKGRVKPNSFSHVHKQGCSIQRDSVAENVEMLEFVKNFLSGKDDRAWKGVLVCRCDNVRSIMDDKTAHRAICAYDTADMGNPSHAELCQTQYVIDEADEAELRFKLFSAFNSSDIITPLKYRGGAIWNSLPQSFQARA